MASPSSASLPGELLLRCPLNYEIWMLEETYHKFLNDALTSDVVIKNSLIESFCVHARNIIELLERGRKYTKRGYQAFSTVKNIGEIKDRLSSQISHLEHRRVAATDISNRINLQERVKILNILSAELSQFKANLSRDYEHIAIRDLAAMSLPTYTGQSTTTAPPVSTVIGPFGTRN